MSNFSALADRVEQAEFSGLSEAAGSGWISLAGDVLHDAVVSAAILATTAFRMRDNGALTAALRGLALAVADLEVSSSVDDD